MEAADWPPKMCRIVSRRPLAETAVAKSMLRGLRRLKLMRCQRARKRTARGEYVFTRKRISTKSVSSESCSAAPVRVEPLRAELPPVTGPQQYQVQFSTTEEHVQLIERAKALLARSTPGKSLGELHLEAMRHVPAAVRRAVYERDGARCTFVDESGQRCRETHYLELHHRLAFGRHGAHTAANLTLHCRIHNALAAELDFGREYMAQKRPPGRHESLGSERRAARQTTGEPD
jgi:hypothetical protein